MPRCRPSLLYVDFMLLWESRSRGWRKGKSQVHVGVAPCVDIFLVVGTIPLGP